MYESSCEESEGNRRESHSDSLVVHHVQLKNGGRRNVSEDDVEHVCLTFFTVASISEIIQRVSSTETSIIPLSPTVNHLCTK